MTVPHELRTDRLVIRPWRAEDAVALHPILEANWAHLGPWIPARVATPVPVAELAVRLAGFAADFEAAREWRYGVFALDTHEILGEIGLYPRSATGRVPYAGADRIEVGYWLRSDVTGRGYATEAARAVIRVASTLDRLNRVEIRCDPRNVASAAIPRRLGFTLESTLVDSSHGDTQVWAADLPLS